MREQIKNILAQETLQEADITLLVANLSLLSEDEKVRLGFSTPKVEAEIAITDTPAVEVEPVKKRVRKAIKK